MCDALQGQNSEIWGLKPAQRGLLGTMESGSRAVKDAEDELGKREEVPVGNDPVSDLELWPRPCIKPL
jgi:hypothetical protein